MQSYLDIMVRWRFPASANPGRPLRMIAMSLRGHDVHVSWARGALLGRPQGVLV